MNSHLIYKTLWSSVHICVFLLSLPGAYVCISWYNLPRRMIGIALHPLIMNYRIFCKILLRLFESESSKLLKMFFLVGWDLRHQVLRPLLAYCTAPNDRWGWLSSNWWNEDWQGKPKYSEKTYPSATLSTTNHTWPDPGANPGRRGGKPATNRFSYGAALLKMLVLSNFFPRNVSDIFLNISAHKRNTKLEEDMILLYAVSHLHSQLLKNNVDSPVRGKERAAP
jgi:hypothetical protein